MATKSGPGSPCFVTGKSHDANGYIVLSSKMWGSDRGRREHRVVMERELGRSLSRTEIIHHINGNKGDNRLENLSVETRASHNREHHGKGRDLVCAKCSKSKWYTPAVIVRMTAVEYMCRKCRYGRDYDNRKKVKP